jgi:hypothetical protein
VTRVAVCVPSGELLHADFALSLAALLRQTRVERISLFNQRMSLLPESRNALVRDALADDATHILWLDSDMIVPSITLDRLLAHDAPIVGATYLRRTPPHRLLGEPDINQCGAPEGMTRMVSMPFGCLLVQANLFRALAAPWFRLDYEGAQPIGEDIGFCRHVRPLIAEAIFNDDWLTTQVSHIGSTAHRLAVPAVL